MIKGSTVQFRHEPITVIMDNSYKTTGVNLGRVGGERSVSQNTNHKYINIKLGGAADLIYFHYFL